MELFTVTKSVMIISTAPSLFDVSDKKYWYIIINDTIININFFCELSMFEYYDVTTTK